MVYCFACMLVADVLGKTLMERRGGNGDMNMCGKDPI